MIKRFVTVGLALLSFVVAGTAVARPGREPRQQRPAVQEEHDHPQQTESSHPQQAPAQAPAAQNQQGRNGFGEVGQSGNLNANQFQQLQGARMGARMSVEDRRKLRRQINEAGQDIYQGQKK